MPSENVPIYRAKGVAAMRRGPGVAAVERGWRRRLSPAWRPAAINEAAITE